MAKEVSEEVIKVAETLRLLQEHLQCVICLETLRDPASTRCGHTFCQQCINRIAKGKNALCPLCNTRINRRGIVDNDKIRSLVQTMHVMISSAQKDVTVMGYEDALLLQQQRKLSTKESLSSPGRGNPVVTVSAEQKPNVSKRSSKVESWLMGVAPISSTQESSPSTHADTSPNEYSDSEMVSVSQINPDCSLKNPESSKRKPLSAYIEDDCEPENSTSKQKSVKIKNNPKSLSSKKIGLSRAKSKQESVKSFFGRTNQTSIAASSAANTAMCGMKVPDPVIVVIHGEKENTTNPLPSRSPGWSRVQKMKKDFHQTSKVLKTSNSKGDNSPVIIEDTGSGDEQPCLNLSLDSPVLKKKAKVNEIVNNLESELKIFEKSIQSKNSTPVKTSQKSKRAENCPTFSTSIDPGTHPRKPIVQFLKLGSIVAKKMPSVPIYLRGSLEHLHCADVLQVPHRLFADAQTQTSSGASIDNATKPSDFQKQLSRSPAKILASPHTRRSGGVHSYSDIEMMDAETVLFTQPVVTAKIFNKIADTLEPSPANVAASPCTIRSGEVHVDSDPEMMDAETVLFTQPAITAKCLSNAADQLLTSSHREPALTETDLMETEIVEIPGTILDSTEDSQKSIYFACSQGNQRSPQKDLNASLENTKLSQQSDVIISSQNAKENQNDSPELENTTHVIPQVDLDSSSSSGVSGRKTKKVQAVRSSSDSSDSEIVVSRKRTDKWKKKKSQVLSDNEDSCPNDLNISAVDTRKIMANIAAQLEDTEVTQSPEWYTDAKKRIAERASAVAETLGDDLIDQECIDVFDTSRTEVDSDGDSEFINPTPQKQSSFMSRSVTQSDDIVPSSQPPTPIQKLLPPLLQNPLKETTMGGTNSLHNKQAISSNKSPSPCNESKGEKEDTIVQEFVAASSPVLEATSEPVHASSTTAAPAVSSSPSTPKPVFVCSSIAANLACQVEKLASIVGGEFSLKFTENTTHLIVRVDDSNRADKTLKYLSAVAAGKWVVSFAWVQKSLEAKKLVPEEPFEALDTSGEPGPKCSREARIAQKKLFNGFEFCCIGEFQDLSKSQLEVLLKESGASIVPRPTDFSFQDHIIPVTLAQWEDSKEQEYTAWLDQYSSPLVQHEWVLDCIGKFSVTSFSPMLLCDASEDVLSSMGIPAYLFEYIDTEQ